MVDNLSFSPLFGNVPFELPTSVPSIPTPPMILLNINPRPANVPLTTMNIKNLFLKLKPLVSYSRRNISFSMFSSSFLSSLSHSSSSSSSIITSAEFCLFISSLSLALILI
eukprot:NODE_355_length_10246_cov_0.288263.p7 type:complete len:111 gc:universal NODE_355_length_10246_cov_0.288263:7228-6896(-)